MKRRLRTVIKLPSAILITTLLLSVVLGAPGYAHEQQKNGSIHRSITISFQKETLESAIRKIKKQTGVLFAYDPETLHLEKLYTPVVSFKDSPVSQVLDKLLSPHQIGYHEVSNTIVLQKLAEPAKEQSKAQQERRVTGQVTDENGEPLTGVTVVLKGTTRGTSTDVEGRFTLSIPNGAATLVFSYLGYLSQEVASASGEIINIKMQVDNQALSEVVVVGYGTQKKIHSTGALSTLEMSTKANQPITDASQALHGVPGLWVNQAGSQPGQDGATIRIRGIGTLNNSDPLVLLDGIEYPISEINPNDIESITVLKDASAAIYGSRAANGVILIKSKMGRVGENNITYSTSFGIQRPTKLPDVLTDPIQYMQMRNQAVLNEGKLIGDYSDDQIEEYRNGMRTDPIVYPASDWFDLVLEDGFIQQHNLAFRGGVDKTQYNISLGYMDQKGIFIANDKANRYSLDMKLSTQITDRLKVGGSVTGNLRQFHEPGYGASTVMSVIMRGLPIFTDTLANGTYGNTWLATPGRNNIENPRMEVQEGTIFRQNQRFLVKVFSEYKLPFDLIYNVDAGYDKHDRFSKDFIPQMYTYNPKTGEERAFNGSAPRVRDWSSNHLNLTLYHTLNWSRQFGGNHSFAAMVGSSYVGFDNRSFDAYTEGFFDNQLTDLNAGSTNQVVRGQSTKDRLLSYFGRVNYAFRDKYLLEITSRYDGSSRFAPANRWSYFPAISTGWNIHQENFLQNIHQINLLKLRASWGKMGNQSVPLYSYLSTVNTGSSYQYAFGNTIQPGAAITNYNDPDISWESTTSYNAGLDVMLWNGKIGMTADVFKRRTSGILRPVGIPAQIGNLGGPQKNIGVVDNTGYEVTLTHRNTVGKFSYDVMASINYVKNEVVDLNGETIISGRRIIKEGYPIDSYYLLQANGYYQNQEEIDYSATVSNAVKPGYIKYRDLNRDGKIDGDDRVITGKSMPDYTFSFGINLNYNRFSLNSYFQGVSGISIYPTANLAFPFNNGAGITRDWIGNTWTPENPNARYPLLTTATGATENFQNSTFWLRDASYLRLQNIQLSYSLPDQLLAKIKIKKLALFVNGQNLVTWTDFKLWDPEQDIKADNLYDYPMMKTLSTGLNVTF
ncbi:TonB-dependent receptor [Rufibacter roseus]|uniref:TonB-dependent receptor n=1 Tax=Rufibacter roseus TaxID=1567108 RepID=A0ABW2DLX2_9BACT|nr:TonB-dependent receptor [Rufibacter roseus]